MAFRISAAVVRGEIDNREKGIVRGRIWLAERAAPLILQLTGNAHPDLAGCLLTFHNPGTLKPDDYATVLHGLQRGTAGDLTASRKVRVFEVPLPEALAMIERGEKPPERIANCLYLEWFSTANGRIVIEATDFLLHISSPQWRMTPEEDEQRARHAAFGMAGFLAQLAHAVEVPDAETECDTATFRRDDDLLVLRETDTELDSEPGSTASSDHGLPLALGAGGDSLALPTDNLEPTKEVTAQRPGEGAGIRKVHPLARRCVASAARSRERSVLLGWLPSMNADLDKFLDEFRTAAEILMSLRLESTTGEQTARTDAAERSFEPALSRTLDHLRSAQAALSRVALTGFLPRDFIADGGRELIEIHLGVLALMFTHGYRQS